MATVANARFFPHFWYAAEAEEAAQFYCSLFPDSHVDSVFALPADTPSGPAGTLKIVQFTLFGTPVQAMSDGRPHHEFNDAISFVVKCEDQAEIDKYWEAFLENGGEPQGCGWLMDRWGVRWQIVPAALYRFMVSDDKDGARRVIEALMPMVKIDVAELEKAYASVK
ncbi:VOC family protein [bacterium]|nr:VOC family protein [bacterium]